jgi:hypothetical protein
VISTGGSSKAVAIGLVALLPGALAAATDVSGVLSTGAEWTASRSPYTVTADTRLPAGQTLEIGPGVTVGFRPGVSLVVQGTLAVQGTAEAGVKFTRADAATAWAGVAIVGATALATVEYLELDGADRAVCSLPGFPGDFPSAFKITNGAKAHIGHSWFHDFVHQVIDISGGGELLISDTKIENGMETIHSSATYCLIERVTIHHVFGYSDFIDFDLEDAKRPSVIRGCFFDWNEEEDGLDTQNANCLIEDCVFNKVGGKALDFEGPSTPIARNILVAGAKWGLVSKDSCTAVLGHLTLVDCETGVSCYEKNSGRGGGHATGDSLIIWGNTKQVDLDALSSFTATYSDIGGGYAGAGNIDIDPLFVDAAGGDFHLTAASPAVGAGKDGSDMGCYPYDGPPPPPEFVRGDTNGDGWIDLSDAIGILFHLYAGAPAGACPDALDVDDSGIIDGTDPARLLLYLYEEGTAPPAPFPALGPDPTDDPLTCTAGE